MSTIIVYYSHGGSTKKLAEEAAQKEGAELCEVKEVKPLRGIGTFFVGCPQALSGKARAIQPLNADLAQYDKIILMAPIWAGSPAPAINGAIALLPAGKEVVLRMVSSSGGSSHDKVAARVEARGCHVAAYEDLKRAK